MDFYTAKTQFNNYLKDYDCHNDKIRLKIVHTYGVVKESADIAARMKLSEEDTSLAKMIAPVSYTHLDVYKRQIHFLSALTVH